MNKATGAVCMAHMQDGHGGAVGDMGTMKRITT